MAGSIKLGKLFGIPININYTWFVIFALITVSFATVQYPSMYPRWSATQYWIAGVITALLLFASVLAHELAHSVISRARGTPVEGITLFIFGGVASIKEESRRPQDELIMSAAGPLSSLVIALIFWIVSQVAPRGTLLAGLFLILAGINLSLAIFNMIPGFPLDGGRVLRSLIWWATNDMRLATRVASAIGRGIAALMIFSGLLVAVLGNWSSGLWLAFIGWFLENAASQSYQQFMLREALAGVTARNLMTTDCVRIEDDPDLQTLVEERLLREGRRCMLVTRGDQLAGMITLHNIKNVPKERWSVTTVSQVMTPFGAIKTVDINDSALSILRRMDEEDVNQIPVMDGGRLIGMVTREHLLRFIRTKAELGL